MLARIVSTAADEQHRRVPAPRARRSGLPAAADGSVRSGLASPAVGVDGLDPVCGQTPDHSPVSRDQLSRVTLRGR
jgi:hypothetical protein